MLVSWISWGAAFLVHLRLLCWRTARHWKEFNKYLVPHVQCSNSFLGEVYWAAVKKF